MQGFSDKIARTTIWCWFTGGVRLQEVPVIGGLTVALI